MAGGSPMKVNPSAGPGLGGRTMQHRVAQEYLATGRSPKRSQSLRLQASVGTVPLVAGGGPGSPHGLCEGPFGGCTGRTDWGRDQVSAERHACGGGGASVPWDGRPHRELPDGGLAAVGRCPGRQPLRSRSGPATVAGEPGTVLRAGRAGECICVRTGSPKCRSRPTGGPAGRGRAAARVWPGCPGSMNGRAWCWRNRWDSRGDVFCWSGAALRTPPSSRPTSCMPRGIVR